ncbi:MAG: SPOR domain-containing protein [Desulfobacteraceae bacterium]|nr:SPOR domain-containing protein [Desulfobacteraceae bacterium]
MAIYDSFLPSPLARSGLRDLLTARLARFYLARPDKDPAGLEALRSYLKNHPDDRVVAKAWLRAVACQPVWDEADEAAADGIAEARADDAGIQQVLGRRFLSAGRTDFLALEVYRRIIRREPAEAAWWRRRLATLFLNEGRCDNFALEIYLAAWNEEDRSDLRRGLAACLIHLEAEAGNRRMLSRARALLGDADEVDLEIFAEGFRPPRSSAVASMRAQPPGRRVREAGAAAWAHLGRQIGGVRALLRGSPTVRWVAGGVGGAVVVAAAAAMLYNTYGHLREPAAPTAPPPAQAEVEKPLEIVAVTDPFTIQVAAYLKREHAERFVAELRAKGLDAQWQEAHSQDKTWYQVRISHFPDKAAALDYGQRLKREGIIDDFYVVNYDRP